MTQTRLHPLTDILERSLIYGGLKCLAVVTDLEERFRPLEYEPEYPAVVLEGLSCNPLTKHL